MHLSEIIDIFNADCPHALQELRAEADRIFVTLAPAMPDGRTVAYTLALSNDQLRDAIDPRALIMEHIRIADADVKLLAAGGGSPLPMWGMMPTLARA